MDGASCRAGLGGVTKAAKQSGIWHHSLCFFPAGTSLGGLSLVSFQAWPKCKHLIIAGQAQSSGELICMLIKY